MDEKDKKFLEGLNNAIAAAMHPNINDSEKEKIFWDAFAIDEYEDIKVGSIYNCSYGFGKLKAFDMKITGLFDGDVALIAIEGGISAKHPVEEFRELVKKGNYTRKYQ